MKNFDAKARREIAWIAVISGLALSPLLLVSWNSRFRTSTPPPKVMRLPAAPVVVKQQENLRPILLSPNSRWEARTESSPPTSTAPPPNAGSKDVVIRSARSGQEIFRASDVGKFRKWVRGTNAFITQDNFGLTLFSTSVATPGAGAPAEPWTGLPLAFAPGTDMDEEDKKNYALNGDWAFGSRMAMNFSPDGRFAVRSSWNLGEIEWTVADLSTQKFAKPIKIGRWLDFGGGAANNIAACVAPIRNPSQGTGAPWPLVAVIQKFPRIRSKTAPAPRPTYSAAQRQFLEREQRFEREKMDAMVGSSPQIREKYFRLMREEARNFPKRMAERERLFPPTLGGRRQNKAPRVSDSTRYRIDCFDLQARKRLWTRLVFGFPFMPQAQFSPDGAALVVWGATRLIRVNDTDSGFDLEDTGIDFLDPRTGKSRAAFRLYEGDFGIPQPEGAIFYSQSARRGPPHGVVAFSDERKVREKRSERTIPVLRFFDTTLAREIGHLDLDARQFPHAFDDGFSTDDAGTFWLLSSDDDLRFLPRSQLGREFFKPLPSPTPIPPRPPAGF